jgi:hypothetical protein
MEGAVSPGPFSSSARGRGWRASVALMVVIVVQGLAACSSSSPHRVVASRCPSRAPEVVATDYLHGTQQPISSAAFVHAVPGARELATARALLVGPHSSIALDAIAVTNRVGATAACALGLPRSITARAAHQLVLFDIGDPPSSEQMGLPECLQVSRPSCETFANPTIVIAGRSRPLPVGSVIVASVPARSKVALQMNDGGRPQDLDLRTGIRTREASPLYYPVLNESLGLGATITADWASQEIRGLRWYGSPVDVTLYGGPGGGGPISEATLAPYDDGVTWAPSGRAWLLVSLNVLPEHDGRWGFRADVPGSFSLTLPDGATLRPRAGTASYKPSARGGPGKVSLVFEVPSALRTFRLAFTPVGTLYPPDGLPPVHVTKGQGRSRGQILITM